MVSVQSGNYSVQGAQIFIPTLSIQQFYQEIRQIHRELKGTVILTNHEYSMLLKMIFHPLGQLHVEGSIQELPSVENKLTFEFQLNQSYLLRVIDGLKTVVD